MAGPGRFHLMRGERRHRRRRQLSLLLGLVMIASLAIPVGVASAGIGASGTGAPLSTAGPDLRTATIQSVPLETVRFCFDQTVANFSGDQGAFHLTGYNDTLLSTGTNIAGTGDPSCLDVEFANSGSDISTYTVGTVDSGLFTDSSGNNNNTVGSAALNGFAQGASPIAGRTTGPDLTGATKSINTVTYTYDEKLDPTYACQLPKFGFWDNTGTENAAPALSCVYPAGDPFSVQVTFGPGTADNAVRYFSLFEAVRDRGDDGGGDTDESPLGSTTQDISCAGPVDCTADLTAVSRLSDELVRFTFDQGAPGTTCTATNFEVYEEDGSQYLGNSCVVESSAAGSTIVTVDFDGGPPTTSFSPFETPTAGANEGALTGVTNTHGALALAPGSQEASGFTDAPDLEAATFGTFNRVTFDFDEKVNTVVNPLALCIVDVNGIPDCANPSPGTVTVNDDKVTKEFTPATFNTAVGAITLDGAVNDYPGNTSTQAAVGRGPAANAGTVQFSASTYSVNEGSTATITVTRTGGSSGAASVQYSTSNGTATGADYTGTSGTLNWADGDASSRSFNVSTTDDFLGEGSETVNLSLFGATGAALGTPSAATLSIIDNDAAGSLAFSASTYSVSESAGIATITVTRSGGSSGSVSVNYSTSNGTATAGSDYSSSAGTLFFGNGVTSQTFNVPITNDTAVEGNETVNLSLSGPSGATLGFPTTAVLTITDDDVVGAGVLALGSATNTVDEDAGSLTLTVNRTGGTTGVVSVNYSTTPGSANAGSDYQAVTGTVTFLAGETTKTFLVPILNDAVHESTESFTVSLSNPNGGATIGTPGSSTVSITDDDPAAPGQVMSSVSIRYKARRDVFKGRVFTPTAPTNEMSAVCRDDREVVLRKTNGARKGTSFTGPEGRWRVPNRPNPNGGWYAVVKETGPRTLSDGSQIICTRAQSRVIFP